MTPMLYLLGGGAVWLAVWHRIEGGSRVIPIPTGTTMGRVFWALACAALLAVVLLLRGHLILAAEVGGAEILVAFVAALLCIHKPWQRVGAPISYGGSNSPLFVVMGSFFGALQVALMLAPLAYFSDWSLLWWAVFGAAQGPLYVVGRFLPYGGSFIDAPTAWGELFAGAAFGAALVGATMA